jgi:2-polyprenyl-3-methyl-5-hydroxy-6-metoxy-1,4-benzoquinol methylase
VVNGKPLHDVDSAQDEVLENLSSARNYRGWLIEQALAYTGPHVLEVGAGNGDYAAELLAHGVQRLTLTELEPNRRAALVQRFAGDSRVTVLPDASISGGDYSCVLSFNVIEHVENDSEFVVQMAQAVAPAGHVFIFTPAFEFAFSNFDALVGHYRRYRTGQLRSLMMHANLEPIQVRYFNPLGLIAWLVLMRAMKRTPQDGPLLRLWDRLVIPIARKLDQTLPSPFGQSVIAVGKKS